MSVFVCALVTNAHWAADDKGASAAAAAALGIIKLRLSRRRRGGGRDWQVNSLQKEKKTLLFSSFSTLQLHLQHNVMRACTSTMPTCLNCTEKVLHSSKQKKRGAGDNLCRTMSARRGITEEIFYDCALLNEQ